MPFRDKDGLAKQIQQDIYKDMMSKKSEFENSGTELIQMAAKELGVYDTGFLALNSNMNMFGFFPAIIWRFQTLNTPYDVFPRNGWGTSESKGPRQYDILAGNRMLQKYKVRTR